MFFIYFVFFAYYFFGSRPHRLPHLIYHLLHLTYYIHHTLYFLHLTYYSPHPTHHTSYSYIPSDITPNTSFITTIYIIPLVITITPPDIIPLNLFITKQHITLLITATLHHNTHHRTLSPTRPSYAKYLSAAGFHMASVGYRSCYNRGRRWPFMS